MDAETYKVVRSGQLTQLAACYPSIQLKEDQALALPASVSDSSSQPFLAAVILFLARFASPDDKALAMAHPVTDQAALADAASKLAAEGVNSASASRSSLHDTPLASKSPAANSSQGGAGHSASPLTGVEEVAVSYDNGGNRSSRLLPSSFGNEQAPLLCGPRREPGAPESGAQGVPSRGPVGPSVR